MQFFTALLAFLKALPELSKLLTQLTDLITQAVEVQQIKQENKKLTEAIKQAKEQHNTKPLDDMFGGIK